MNGSESGVRDRLADDVQVLIQLGFPTDERGASPRLPLDDVLERADPAYEPR